MRRQSSQQSLPLIFLVCVVCLTGSILLLLPIPSFSPNQSAAFVATLPKYISVSIEETTYSTPSATLISETSLKTSSKGFSLFRSKSSFSSPLDASLVSHWIQDIASVISRELVLPAIEFQKATGKVEVSSGSAGVKVNTDATLSEVMRLDLLATSTARLRIERTGTVLSEEDRLKTARFADMFRGKTLVLSAPHYSRTLVFQDIIELLDPLTGVSSASIAKLSSEINTQIGTDPVEPILIVVGKDVTQFTAPKEGRQIDATRFTTDITQRIDVLATTKSVEPLELAFTNSSPKNSLASVNTLGITERIGLGESEYAHSIPNRVKNVSLTTSRIHSKLILPDEEFSFNKYLGEVSAATGFLPAYVIKEGQTVLGDGGGVCQVSSTLFRAILNAGLPVTERRGHSYRVSYYEENSRPGFDATVYSPHPDLRFKNDTNAPILINAIADPKTLSMYIELWGKSDGRTAEILNYKKWDAQPAPPPVYQDVPTLKPGQLKQIDWAAPGLKTSFDYVVTYPDGSVQKKNFATNYIPWRAVYLRGI